MHAIRKSDLECFPPNAKSVCRIEENSTNPYLSDERIIEEFLRSVEPFYNQAVSDLRHGDVSDGAIYVISGFVAYVMTCSPGGMRINAEPLRGIVSETASQLDAKGELPKVPSELGGSNLSDMLESGEINLRIDEKYPQAIGIASVLRHAAAFGNFVWDIIMNSIDDSPFFTSDFPVALERDSRTGMANKIVPLAPDIAVRIRPNPSVSLDDAGFDFSAFRYRHVTSSRKQVRQLNSLIVECAEDLVFFRDYRDWVKRFIERRASCRIEPLTETVPSPDGTILITTQKIQC